MFDATSLTLQKALGMRMQQHAMHVSNIANANVPEYKAKTMDFTDRLSRALESTNDEAPQIAKENEMKEQLSEVEAHMYEDPFARPSGDGNTVNVDKEQAELAKNTIAYQGAIQLLNKRLTMQKFVLSEGGR